MSLDHLLTLLPPTDIFPPSSERYAKLTQTWSLAKQKHPRLVVRPTTIDALSTTIAYLTSSDLHFKVRSQGFGSASAYDVLVCLDAFDDFSFQQETENEGVVYLGAGQSWGDYYRKMDETAPEFGVVGARTPSIGVGGSILCGGFGWLSGEYGCISDPANLLDVKIVKIDGTVLWASEEPELLWALRGTQGAYGIAVQYKLRARRYTQSIWTGPILFPRSAMKEIAQGSVAMDKARESVKTAFFCYNMKKEKLKIFGVDEDMIVMHVFDANGEEHGRSEKGFKWALDIPGVVDKTVVTNIRGVASLQTHINDLKGTARGWWFPLALPNLTEDIMYNAWKWHEEVSNDPATCDNAYLLFELFSCNKQIDGNTAASSGWPRPAFFRHTILLGAGSRPDATKEEDETAQRLLQAAPRRIIGPDAKLDITPNGMEIFHPLENIFGNHLPKLREIKRKYDPQNRLNSLITPA